LGIWEGFPASSSRNSHDIVPPPSPVSGLKSLFMENFPPDLGQLSGRSHLRGGLSRRQSHLITDISPANGAVGFGQQDDFASAVSAMSARHDDHNTGLDSWRPATPTSKLAQRQFALQLCGWSLREEELNNAIRMQASSVSLRSVKSQRQ
jgi:WD repeat-containing protein mio